MNLLPMTSQMKASLASALFVLIIITGDGYSQPTNPPPIEWQRSFGGSGDDVLRCVRPTSDGGFIAAGYSMSPISGNKTSTNFGLYDFWVVRTDQSGNILWDRSFGGTSYDWAFCVEQTADEGFILGGDSVSDPSGNKGSTNFGHEDF